MLKGSRPRYEFKHLLAKGSKCPDRPRVWETLPRHLLDVTETARAIVESVGDRCLQSLGLKSSFYSEALSPAVMRGAFLHDLGKANHQFQRMIREGPRLPQALRHEWISAWLPLRLMELDHWLFAGCSEQVRYAALVAALGHHLQVADGAMIAPRQGSTDAQVIFLGDHPDCRGCLTVARDIFGLPEPPPLERMAIDLLSRPLAELRNWLLEAFDWHTKADAQPHRFAALVKALVIAADVAGSAIPRQGGQPGQWTRHVLGRVCTEGDLRTIAETRLAGHLPRPFQDEVAQSQRQVTFVKAGCGSGKTVAAYLWAARRAQGRKLFVCYPTTGTATEGYRDYIVPDEIAAEAALLHSRSEVDLEDLLDTHSGNILERAIRIEALAAWDVPLVICTADQVLGLLQNNRRALFSSPSIGNGAFVFDEIHQYDDRLFGALLRFLEAFQGAPTLLMTASLPQPRLRAIQTVLGRMGATLEVIAGPADLEHIERYTLSGPVKDPPWDTMTELLSRGGKVLWVANTVDRAVLFAQEAKRRALQPLLYHSRYRYCDRVQRHTEVVEAFKASEAVLAITTQVCEVSLDLSADLLITDLAPIPALIQRLGRLNRRVTPEQPGQACLAIILEPSHPRPYEQDDIMVARTWILMLGASPLSQAALTAAFESLAETASVARVESAWLDGGPFSRPAPLREAEATIAVIHVEDGPRCMDEQGRPIPKAITRYAIPMLLGPVAGEIGGWKRLGFAFVAPSGRIAYSADWGAQWLGR